MIEISGHESLGPRKKAIQKADGKFTKDRIVRKVEVSDYKISSQWPNEGPTHTPV